MGFFTRRPSTNTEPVAVPDDIGEARALRQEASEEHRRTMIRGFGISQLTSELAARRVLNHFGDDIAITFTRRTP